MNGVVKPERRVKAFHFGLTPGSDFLRNRDQCMWRGWGQIPSYRQDRAGVGDYVCKQSIAVA